jgi:N-acetylneuraminic acid mutarotase
LWIKANEPENVSVGSDIDGIESISIAGYLPVVTRAMSCARVGTKIYMFGGTKGDAHLYTISVFDTETQSITTIDTTLPRAMYGMGCVATGNKIYLFGGWGSSFLSTISVFDTETESITTIDTTLPTACSNMGCTLIGNKVYLLGGQLTNSNGVAYLNTVNIFDIETEELITSSIELPLANACMGCVSVGTKIYMFGGIDKSNIYGKNTIVIFDTATGEITTLSTALPQNKHRMGCARVGTKVYLFGGRGSDSSTHYSSIDMFDTETEELITLTQTLADKCARIGCAVVDNKVYLLGGAKNDASSGVLNLIQKFSVTHELAQGDIEVQSGLLKNKFNLINTENAQVEIGVENVYIGNENNEAERVDAYLHNGTEWAVIE